MHIFLFLKSFFAVPQFEPGERVNLVRRGTIERTDGYVIGQMAEGVLVEWPRAGSSYVDASDLSVIS